MTNPHSTTDWGEKLTARYTRAVEHAVLTAREEAIAEVVRFIEGGHFLNSQSLAAQFSREVVAGIRRAIRPTPPTGTFRDQSRRQLIHDALSAAAQRFEAENSEGNAHAEHLCRQALAALADENGAVEAPRSHHQV